MELIKCLNGSGKDIGDMLCRQDIIQQRGSRGSN